MMCSHLAFFLSPLVSSFLLFPFSKVLLAFLDLAAFSSDSFLLISSSSFFFASSSRFIFSILVSFVPLVFTGFLSSSSSVSRLLFLAFFFTAFSCLNSLRSSSVRLNLFIQSMTSCLCCSFLTWYSSSIFFLRSGSMLSHSSLILSILSGSPFNQRSFYVLNWKQAFWGCLGLASWAS